MMTTRLESYLYALASKLRLEPGTQRDVLLEVGTHLQDRAAELESTVLSGEEALEQAIHEFGRPETIARNLYLIHSKGSWRDTVLATVPHLLLAVLFVLHLWTSVVWMVLVLGMTALVSFRAWKAGRPKWSYPWLGYTLAAPALSWGMALIAVGYGSWTYVTTGALPFSLPTFLLLAAYVPFSLWLMVRVGIRVIRRDWLLASLTALPFPFLTSWLLFLNWQGGLWSAAPAKLQETDGDRALVFLVLAIVTAVFFKISVRLLQIALLTLATAALVALSFWSSPFSASVLAVVLVTLASVALLLSPALVGSKVGHEISYPVDFKGTGEVITHWFASAR
ncbi:MAG: hypothetical protein ACE5IG_02760 [Dehalococcoidia bacterium]